MDEIPFALADFLRGFRPADLPEPHIPDFSAALDDLERRRKRINDAYEAGYYDIPTAKAKNEAIDQQAQALRDQQVNGVLRHTDRVQLLHNVEEIQSLLDDLPAWMVAEEPRKVNYLLRHLLDQIIVTPELDYSFKLIGE